MPENECERNSAVSGFTRRLLLAHHRFNTPQKSVIGLLLLCSFAATCLHWLHICAFLIVYGTVVYLTNVKCTTALRRIELYRSELILSFFSSVKDGLSSVLKLLEREESDSKSTSKSLHDETGGTNFGASSGLAESDTTSGQSSQRHSSTGQEEDGACAQSEKNTVNDEIERFLNLVMRDFVQSWYKTLSPDPDVVEEIHEILYQAALQICKSRLAELNVKDITCDVIKLYQQHLGTVIVCKAFLRSQPKRRRASTTWVSSLEEAFQQKHGYHVALQDGVSEINYVRSLVDIVLVRLLPIQIHRCRIARALVTEILTCNVILPLMDMTSTTDWIHKAVIEIFGEESTAGSVLEQTCSDSTNTQTSEIVEELQTFRSISHSNDAQSVGDQCCSSCENHEDKSSDLSDSASSNITCAAGPGGRLENIREEELMEKTGRDETSVSLSDKGTHFTMTPHEEITVSNASLTDSPGVFRRHSVIGAADWAEEAGEMFEERQPPNGKASSPVFSESNSDFLVNGLAGIISRSHKKLTRVFSTGSLSPERSLSPNSVDREEDSSEFKDANSEYSPQLNGFLPDSVGDGVTENFKECSLPFTLLKPSTVTQSSKLHASGKISNSAELNSVDVTSSSPPNVMHISSESHNNLTRQAAVDRPDSLQTTLSAGCTDLVDVPCAGKNKQFHVTQTKAISDVTSDKYPREATVQSSLEGKFYLDHDIEDAEDVECETDTHLYKPQENWANLARNIPNSTDIESALANCMPVCKPDEYRVLDSKTCLFHSVAIPTTDTITDRGASSYTIYKIEFEAWYWADGEVVLRKGTVMRRFREFVNLQARLEDNPAYKTCLKDVKGPKRWMSLPFGNMDKAAIEGRRKYLEKFLKLIIEKEVMCNGEEMKEFLAYEGRSHIAFVRKAPELTVPRIDKMFVKTVSGVFGRIATVLPTLTPDVLPSLSRKDSTPGTKLLEESSTLDEDAIELNFGVIQNELPHIALYEKFMDDYLRRIQQDEMPTHSMAPGREELNSGPDHGSGIHDSDNDSADHVPQRSDGDGSATPDPPTSQGLDKTCYREIPLARAVLDLGARALRAQSTWVCRENVMDVIQIFLGRALDRWLEDQVTKLTSSEQCCVYLELLRETIWPRGKLSTDEEPVLSEQEKVQRKAQAKKALKEFFPEFLVALVGDEDLQDGISEAIDSVENQKINRHFLYTFLDLVLERLFPELTNQAKVTQKP